MDRVMGRQECCSHMMPRLADEGRNADGSMHNCKLCFSGIFCTISALIYLGTCCSYPICGVPFWSVGLLVSGIVYGLNRYTNISGLAKNVRFSNYKFDGNRGNLNETKAVFDEIQVYLEHMERGYH